MPSDCCSERPRPRQQKLAIPGSRKAGGLCVKLSSVVMLSTVDGAPGEPSQRRNTRPPGTICQSRGATLTVVRASTVYRFEDVQRFCLCLRMKNVSRLEERGLNLFTRAQKHVAICSCKSQKLSSRHFDMETVPK